MWLLKKISCEIQILNEKVGKLMIENSKLEEENKKLKEENEIIMRNADDIAHHNVELMKKVKEHQLYEEKLEHRIIEFEELLHGE